MTKTTKDRERPTDAPSSEVNEDAPAQAAPASAAAAPAPARLTPNAWGRKLGHFKQGDTRLPQNVPHFDRQHAAADELFGWSRHAYNFQAEPFLITEADYVAAIKSAGRFPLEAPHAAALPPSEAARFANFKPRRERVKASR